MNKLRNIIIMSTMLLLLSSFVSASCQTGDVPGFYTTFEFSTSCVLYIQPDATYGIDARVYNWLGDSSTADTNYGNFPYYFVDAWTTNSINKWSREYLKFDLSMLDSGTDVYYAELSLFNGNAPHGGGSLKKTQRSLSYLAKATSSWDEMSITWNNQPGINPSIISVPTPNTTQADVFVDVTDHIIDWVVDGEDNNGWRHQLAKEQKYKRLSYWSSDGSVPSRTPKLTIWYNK